MRLAILWGAFVTTLMTVALPAQERPNFSGQWTLDWTSIPVPPGAAGPGTGPGRGAPAGGNFGEQFTAAQGADTLTIEYVRRDSPIKLTYKLDGTQSKNVLTSAGGKREQLSTAVWEGKKLVITTTTAYGKLKRALSLADGDRVLEIEEHIPEGGPIISRIRYKKS